MSLALVGAAIVRRAVIGALMPSLSLATPRDTMPRPADLPLIEAPAATDTSTLLGVLLTGDGGWAEFDRRLAAALVARGVSVVGLDSRAFLRVRRTPEESAAAVERVIRYYGAAWHRDRVVLVGYSRGADMAPFVVNRLADSLRGRLAVVALIGPAEQANFQFHWVDLITDTPRPTDVPVRPELDRLRDVTVLCVYGASERRSLCPGADTSRVHAQVHPGGHQFSGSIDQLARDILARLPRD